MDAETARAMVADISYKPGWRFSVDSVEDETLYLKFEYNVPNSDRSLAPDYRMTGDVETFWPIDLSTLHTADQFQMAVLLAISQVESHEMREFLSFDRDEYFKPVHPHHLEGQMNWAGFVTGGDPSAMSSVIRADEVYGQKSDELTQAAQLNAELAELVRLLDGGE